jgi:hypothetical protein
MKKLARAFRRWTSKKRGSSAEGEGEHSGLSYITRLTDRQQEFLVFNSVLTLCLPSLAASVPLQEVLR